jgi:phenylalanyl-tRNA synthetase beta chain
LALAGIMGGLESAVIRETEAVFLESAWFRPEAIGVRARHHGLHSESSHRFERGVDPQLQRLAVERATYWVSKICGGRAGPISEATAAAQLPKSKPIGLRARRIERILGMGVAPAEVESILKRLGMQVARAAKQSERAWKVTPPSWRFDIVREVDLIEELVRVQGYDRVPARVPAARLHVPGVPETRVSDHRLRSALIDRDYQEAITYSFVDPALQALIAPATPTLALTNPIASDLAEMRVSLWPGLIQTVRYNLNRQQARVRVFEVGRRFVRVEQGGTDEQQVVAGVACGAVWPEQWGTPAREVDFFDLKADVEALLATSGRRFEFRAGRHPALHPGQTAEVFDLDTGKSIGKLGVFHPELLAKIGLDKSVMGFEILAGPLRLAVLPQYREISRFPAVRRDIAVVVDRDVPAQAVLRLARESAGPLLTNLELFDEYRGEGIDSGRKSLALGLTFQDTSRTLNDEDVEGVVGRVVAALQTGYGAQLRQ